MARDVKPVVDMEDTFDKLEMRVGRVVSATPEPSAPKPAYRLVVDFGKFGVRVSVGRFTRHAAEEMAGRLVVGVLNFAPRQVGEAESQALILGAQYPKADSGEATFLTPAADAKIGGKIF